MFPKKPHKGQIVFIDGIEYKYSDCCEWVERIEFNENGTSIFSVETIDHIVLLPDGKGFKIYGTVIK